MPVKPNEGTIRLEIQSFKDFGCEESEDFNFGNNEWTLGAYLCDEDEDEDDEDDMDLAVYLECNNQYHSKVWSCKASIRFTLINFDDKNKSFSVDRVHNFTNDNNKFTLECFKSYQDIICEKSPFCKQDKVVIDASIRVISSVRFRKYTEETFKEPKEHLTDVVLLVGGKKVHVGKQILAMHSPVFHKLFYGNFVEKSKEEIPIRDVEHSEFVEFLNFIYPTNIKFDDDNVEYVLKLADQFEVKSIMDKAEDFMIDSDGIHMVDKLRYAEKYKLAHLQDNCYDSFKNSFEVFDVTKHARYNEISDVTRALLFEKLAEFNNKP